MSVGGEVHLFGEARPLRQKKRGPKAPISISVGVNHLDLASPDLHEAMTWVYTTFADKVSGRKNPTQDVPQSPLTFVASPRRCKFVRISYTGPSETVTRHQACAVRPKWNVQRKGTLVPTMQGKGRRYALKINRSEER